MGLLAFNLAASKDAEQPLWTRQDSRWQLVPSNAFFCCRALVLSGSLEKHVCSCRTAASVHIHGAFCNGRDAVVFRAGVNCEGRGSLSSTMRRYVYICTTFARGLSGMFCFSLLFFPPAGVFTPLYRSTQTSHMISLFFCYWLVFQGSTHGGSSREPPPVFFVVLCFSQAAVVIVGTGDQPTRRGNIASRRGGHGSRSQQCGAHKVDFWMACLCGCYLSARLACACYFSEFLEAGLTAEILMTVLGRACARWVLLIGAKCKRH